MKQKSQIIVDLYLDSTIPPSTQIDVNHEMQQKLYRSAFRIIQGMNISSEIIVFDEARSLLFKELLPYWSGYKFISNSKSHQIPVMKHEKLLKERLEEFLSTKAPSPINLKLPSISSRQIIPTAQNTKYPIHSLHAQNTTFNIVFSIATGLKIRDEKVPVTASQHDRRNSHMPTTNEK